MKKNILFLFIIVFVLPSCKSHRDVSRSVVGETRAESLVTVNDSSKTHRETSLKSEATKLEERTEYSKRTEFGNDNNVVSTTERVVIYASNLKFNSQLDNLKRDDFKYNGSTQSTNTTDSQLNEDVKETSDSRPIQGKEWVWIILTSVVAIVIMRLIVIKKF